MAKFSQKMMGKEVGQASVYAKPHTMDGKPGAGMKVMQDPNTLAANKMTRYTATPRVSTNDPGADNVKTSGIKIRGTGCATKGVMARGPMA
jgi:hypothetical protein